MRVSKFLTKKSLFFHIPLFVSVRFGCLKEDIRKSWFNFVDGSNSQTTIGGYSSIYLEN